MVPSLSARIFVRVLAKQAAALSLPLVDLPPRQQCIAPIATIRVHTQFFLHSLYALDTVIVSLVASGPVRLVHQVGLLVENALEVVLAHGSVAAVSVQALDTLGGGLLARVEPFALALATNSLRDKVSDWNRRATGRKKCGVSGVAIYLLNFSLVVSFQGSSPLSAWDAILSVAGAAAHLRRTRNGGCAVREWALARERRSPPRLVVTS